MSSTKRQKTESTEHASRSDVRVSQIRPLLPPACLEEMIPISEAAAATVERGRTEVQRVLDVRYPSPRISSIVYTHHCVLLSGKTTG